MFMLQLMSGLCGSYHSSAGLSASSTKFPTLRSCQGQPSLREAAGANELMLPRHQSLQWREGCLLADAPKMSGGQSSLSSHLKAS